MRKEEHHETIDTLKIRLTELLSSNRHTVGEIVANPRNYSVPGVYLIRTPEDSIVYAGRTKTKTVAGRIRDHRSIDTKSDLRGMLKVFKEYPRDVDRYLVQYVEIREDRQRILFEHFLIAILDPPFNK